MNVSHSSNLESQIKINQIPHSSNLEIQNRKIENGETYVIESKPCDSTVKDETLSDNEDDTQSETYQVCDFQYSAPDEDNNVSNLIEEIEFTDGFFKRDLLPMLSKGHEGELCQYLQEIGVLKSTMRCSSEGCDSHPMQWTPSRVVDKYQWVCNKCKKRKSIRENSFFKGIKFIIPIVLRAMQGWCGNYDPADLAESMGMKSYAFRTVYTACRDVAARHMKRLLSTQVLGGPNTVVILEVWSLAKGAAIPIACLIELKDKKFRYFYQPLKYNQQCLFDGTIEKNNNIQSENNNIGNRIVAKKLKLDGSETPNAMETIVDLEKKTKTPTRSRQAKDITGDLQILIKQKVAANSYLVLGEGITKAVAKSLLKTENMNSVKTLEMLRTVEKEANPLSGILGLIMQYPAEVVLKAREIPRGQLHSFLMMHLWYDTYAQKGAQENTLETLLHQIAAEDYSNDKDSDFMSDAMIRFID